ncbi:hypothetical protein HYALB_00012138 [Hymenoscyphus albidus]|uniref:GRF-type domain-containing protein n=1 Tax=Hymenoscyphus albidus TaxID=595503 RepID=A0A9N9LP35_9HELO|nr:hypothetical protein HYALB_00012138 [Hymenoscyphus albidus]
MFSRPSPSSRSAFSSPKKVPLKGLFKDGAWYCNCDPRLPAQRFQVKKDNKNQGKWFYVCQDRVCGLFLWEYQAVQREKTTVLSNARSEKESFGVATNAMNTTNATPVQAKRAGGAVTAGSRNLSSSTDDEFGASPLPHQTASAITKVLENASKPPETPRKSIKPAPFVTLSSKRKWEDTDMSTQSTQSESDDDEFGEFPLSQDEIATVAKIADTPRKVAKINPFETPTGKRISAADIPTPSSGNLGGLKPKNLFGTPAVRVNGGIWDDNEPFVRTLFATPTTPSRFRDAVTESPNNEQTGLDVTDEVMGILKDSNLDEPTTQKLRDCLTRTSLKISGIVRGRDITRIALKNKDTKIAELQQRITKLETEKEMDKLVIKHFKSDVADSVARKTGNLARWSGGGRGRGRGRG